MRIMAGNLKREGLNQSDHGRCPTLCNPTTPGSPQTDELVSRSPTLYKVPALALVKGNEPADNGSGTGENGLRRGRIASLTAFYP